MSSSGNKKVAEGLEHIKSAEKCLKTSFFKWKPDYDGAANDYVKAATCFKGAKDYDKAINAFLRAAEIQHHMGGPFHAAKSYEQAGLLCKENKDLDTAVQMMEKASVMFQEHGTPDTAALTLDKAAKMVEQDRPQVAVEMYTRAADISEIESKPMQCGEYIGKAARLLIRCQKLDEAVIALNKEINSYLEVDNYAQICKVVMGVVLVHLHRDDYVAAKQFFNSAMTYPTFGDGEEAAALEDLLSAYDEGDEVRARTTLALPVFKYLDNAFAKLARSVNIPGGIGGGSASRNIDQNEGGDGEGDDEFAGGIC